MAVGVSHGPQGRSNRADPEPIATGRLAIESDGLNLVARFERIGDILLEPRALRASEILPEVLTDAGAVVTIAPAYRNVPPMGRREELRDQLESGTIDLITFTSSSTVSNFLTMLDAGSDEELHRLLDQTTIAAIGPITADTVREHGLRVDIQPERYTIGDMVQAIVAAYRDKAAQLAR